MTIERSPASLISTPPTTRRSLRFYAGVPRAQARAMLAIVNRGWSPEAWKAEQKRLDRHAHAEKKAAAAREATQSPAAA
jgi:uncharacterized protein YdaU (DUF1376 family)